MPLLVAILSHVSPARATYHFVQPETVPNGADLPEGGDALAEQIAEGPVALVAGEAIDDGGTTTELADGTLDTIAGEEAAEMVVIVGNAVVSAE